MYPTCDEMDRSASNPARRQTLRNPGEPIPKLALRTISVYLSALTVFILSTTAGIAGWVWIGGTIAVNTAVIFMMFSVAHEAVHYLISSKRWVNALFGRLAFIFVTPMASFPAFRFIHIAHHKYVNDDYNDPDAYASRASTWQLPFHWPSAELFYAMYYFRLLRSRPTAEYGETAVLFTLRLAGLTVATATGNLWMLAAVFLIPQRIAITLLGWWFDWLPHHGLEVIKHGNRYSATRVRVGMEWLFTPLMLAQNYHLVHHLHPAIPFYRCARMWRHNEEAYLERNVPIATVFGQQLNSAQYRKWKYLNRKLWRLLPVRRPASSEFLSSPGHPSLSYSFPSGRSPRTRQTVARDTPSVLAIVLADSPLACIRCANAAFGLSSALGRPMCCPRCPTRVTRGCTAFAAQLQFELRQTGEHASHHAASRVGRVDALM